MRGQLVRIMVYKMVWKGVGRVLVVLGQAWDSLLRQNHSLLFEVVALKASALES
jgi:hypothetical protein